MSINSCRPSADVIIDNTEYRQMAVVTDSQITTTKGGTSYFPKGTVLNGYEIAVYMVTYQLYYTVYDWAINNGYAFQNVATAGTVGGDGVLPETFDDDRCQPVCDMTLWDWITFCNAYSRYVGYEPVYYSDSSYSAEIKSSADEKVAAYGSRPYIKASANGNYSPKNCTANGYRIPSFAEWEYAARGGNCNAPEWSYQFAGSNNANEVAVCGGGRTSVVATKKPNSLGIYDMCGNLWELVDTFDIDGSYGSRGGSYGADSKACAIGYNNGITFGGNSCPTVWFTVRMTRSLK